MSGEPCLVTRCQPDVLTKVSSDVRIGRSPIAVPAGVTVTIGSDNVTVKGPQGELSRILPTGISVRQEDSNVLVERPDDQRHHRALHGLTRSLVANMVTGVTAGFTKELEIVGVGYRAVAQGPERLELALGFSHPVVVNAPCGRELRGARPDPHHREGHRQGEGRPGGRRHPQDPQARALQGQGRPLRRRACRCARPERQRSNHGISSSAQARAAASAATPASASAYRARPNARA